MLNQAKLNGVDFESGYGIAIMSGLKNVRTPANPKPAQEQDWPEMNGKEYVLTGALQDIDVSLDCVISAPTVEEFNYRLDTFEAILQVPVLKTLWVALTGRTYNVKFNSITDFDWASINPIPVAKFKLNLTIVQNTEDQPVITTILDGNG